VPLLTADRIWKKYDEKQIIEDASLAIEPGDHIGLIGANGSGKSTLCKILAGLEEPDRGTVAQRRDAEFAYLAQDPALDAEHTAFEVVEQGLADWSVARKAYDSVSARLSSHDGPLDALLDQQTRLAADIERLGGWDASHRVSAMLMHLGIERPEQRIATLSGGERRRVALARILVARPSLAILDEPTNHLDAHTVEWLEEYLVDEFPGALLLITHDRYFLDRVVTRVLEIDRGRLSAFEGNYARYLELKAERLAHDARVEANRLNVLRRERDWLSRQAPARTTKQKARIDRAQALEETVRQERRREELAKLSVASVQSGKRLLELRDVGRELAGRTLFEHVDLFLGPGDRIGIIGKNGAGKTTLVRTMLGEDPPSSGEVTRGNQLRVAYFDQQRITLDDTKTVYENLREGSDKVRVGKDWIPLPSYLDRFLFEGSKQHQAVASLSGGERARVALAKMLRGDANLLVMDEPTNDLDLLTLAALEEMLIGFDGAVVIVTHDRYLLNRVATAILAFEPGGRVTRYAGNYDDYVLQHAAVRPAVVGNAATPRGGGSKRSDEGDVAKKPKDRRGLSPPEVRELQALPDAIDAMEREVATLESALNDPALYATGGSEIAARRTALETARTALAARMARWEELESRKA